MRAPRCRYALFFGATLLSSSIHGAVSTGENESSSPSSETSESSADSSGSHGGSDLQQELDGVFDIETFQLLVDGSDSVMKEEQLESIIKLVEKVTVIPEDLSSAIKFTMERSEATIEQMNSFKKYHNEAQEEQRKLEELVQKANIMQIDYILEGLTQTFHRERELRESVQAQRSKIESGNDTTTSTFSIQTVTKDELKKSFDRPEAMSESEKELEEWIISKADAEIEKFKTSAISDRAIDSSGCAPVSKVLEETHSKALEFSHDGIGKIDHSKGSTIVYEMSSDTYTPPSDPTRHLGDVWWRQFIPEDWEDQLPEGWEDWNTDVPPYLHLLLGRTSTKIPAHEAVLTENNFPGTCWPINGQKGQVTLRLPYPVKISSVSIDHTSAFIVREEEWDSAPKKIKVIGYRPCPESNEKCARMGFDTTNTLKLGQFTFDRESRSTQTFPVGALGAPMIEENDDHGKEAFADDDDDDDSIDSASCSAKAATCSGPPSSIISAITFQVEENWGNPDYTCLYRVRVHGDAELDD